MAQWLRVHIALTADLIVVPSTHKGWLQLPVTMIQGESKTSGLLNTCTHTHALSLLKVYIFVLFLSSLLCCLALQLPINKQS